MSEYGMIVYDRYIPLLRSGTHEKAVQAALEYIWRGEGLYDDGDLSFEIVEVASSKHYTTVDYQDFFEKKIADARKHQKEQQDRIDREQFERLKKKFDKCTCPEKMIDKTNCPVHNARGS